MSFSNAGECGVTTAMAMIGYIGSHLFEIAVEHNVADGLVHTRSTLQAPLA